MSPLSTFQNCGSSSTRVERIKAPNLVTRESLTPVGAKSFRSVRIERIL